MKHLLLKLWRHDSGAETAEWLLIVGLLVAIGVAVYSTSMATQLANLVPSVLSALTVAVGGN